MKRNSISIQEKKIGRGNPCFIIAEAGVNHNGDLDLARQLVDIAAQAGADAVKFQTFTAERLVTPDAPKAEYQQRTTDAAETQLEMLRQLELSPQDYRELVAYCRRQGILFMSTPFDEQSADFLDELGLPVFKTGSGELTNLPFLDHLARKGKPMIISTGMGTMQEVEAAADTVRAAGNSQFVLLHCVSNYPADPADVNLRAMSSMEQRIKVPVGFSDHTPGIEVSLAAVALGACVVEKHFTIDRSLPGPDQAASLEPGELYALVRGIRMVEAALGSAQKKPAASEANTAAVARKSLVAACDIPAGATLCEEMLSARRPGTGLPPSQRMELIGRKTRVTIPAGSLLTWEMLV